MAYVSKVQELNGGNSVNLGVAGRLVGSIILLSGLICGAAIALSGLVGTGSDPVARGRGLVGTSASGVVGRCRNIRLGRLARRRDPRLVGVARRRRIGPSRLLRTGGNNAITGGSGLLGITRGVRSPRRHVIAIAFLLATVARIGPLLLLIARNTRLGRIVGPGRAHTRYHAG